MDENAYVFQFSTQRQADFWMEKTIEKFKDDVVSANKQLRSIQFNDGDKYFFWGANRTGALLKHATIYSPDVLYIILDDPERKRLSTYVSEKGNDLC